MGETGLTWPEAFMFVGIFAVAIGGYFWFEARRLKALVRLAELIAESEAEAARAKTGAGE